ncbi:hypothetical protein GGR52DRAFT_546398 [Hypoxylon sp. FL1284]|nr:hypothetical protein GGR52DRAFT_546398 [Hypoxylon sp. FL1284]
MATTWSTCRGLVLVASAASSFCTANESDQYPLPATSTSVLIGENTLHLAIVPRQHMRTASPLGSQGTGDAVRREEGVYIQHVISLCRFSPSLLAWWPERS